MAVETETRPSVKPIFKVNITRPEPERSISPQFRLWLELDYLQKSIRNHNRKKVMFSLSEEFFECNQIRVGGILEELGLTPDQANRKKSRMLKKIKRETGLESHQTGVYLLNHNQ